MRNTGWVEANPEGGLVGDICDWPTFVTKDTRTQILSKHLLCVL